MGLICLIKGFYDEKLKIIFSDMRLYIFIRENTFY